MSVFQNKKVLITGGGAGIGKIMCSILLERGATVIIWDVNPMALEATTGELSGLGSLEGFLVDVSVQDEVRVAYQSIEAKYGAIDVLINNVGIVVGKYFHEHTEVDIARTMNINTTASMNITRLFLQGMMKQDFGYICNIASSAGLISNPRMSVYAASKWAMLGWSDSLRLEMKQLKKDIRVTTVTPYYINTGMFDGIRSRVPILKPEKVAKQIIRGIEKGRPIVSMPWSYRFVRFFQGLFPVWLFDWFVGDVMGVYKTMEHFKGHSK